jgi:hypothetical protein
MRSIHSLTGAGRAIFLGDESDETRCPGGVLGNVWTGWINKTFAAKTNEVTECQIEQNRRYDPA